MHKAYEKAHMTRCIAIVCDPNMLMYEHDACKIRDHNARESAHMRGSGNEIDNSWFACIGSVQQMVVDYMLTVIRFIVVTNFISDQKQRCVFMRIRVWRWCEFWPCVECGCPRADSAGRFILDSMLVCPGLVQSYDNNYISLINSIWSVAIAHI